jgi:hypothetical protein
MPDILYIKSDNLIEVQGLQNAISLAYLNGATVRVTLADAKTGTNIAGETWPLTLDYFAASNGDYRAVLVDTLVVTEGQRVLATITADAGAGLHREWRRYLQVIWG